MLDANKLGALGTLISDRIEDALEGLSPSAAALLSMLHFKPGLTATELAAIAAVAQPTVTRLVDGLVRQGLVAREAAPGRSTPLRVTEEGDRRAVRLQERRLSALAGLLGVLAPEERAAFAGLVDRVLVGATTSRAFARTTCRLCEHDLCGPEVCPVGCRAGEIERAAGTER
ncbi:MAG: MarR family transcriptional regulator [Hyphomicrobiales bacterium]